MKKLKIKINYPQLGEAVNTIIQAIAGLTLIILVYLLTRNSVPFLLFIESTKNSLLGTTL